MTPPKLLLGLVANSETTGRYLRETFPDAAERVRVATLCIDPERVEQWIANGRDVARARAAGAGERIDKPVVLVVGRL